MSPFGEHIKLIPIEYLYSLWNLCMVYIKNKERKSQKQLEFKQMNSNQRCPDFFTSKEPIPTRVIPLQFGRRVYWMSSTMSHESTTNDSHNRNRNYIKPYDDNDEGLLDCGELEENYDIVLTKSGKFMTSFYVPSSLLSFIIGPKGVKLKNLQRNTNTLIKIPRINEKGDVKITGDTERKVASARTQVSLIVMQRKDRLPPSHFVSIPVDSDLVKEKLMQFKEEILKNPAKGVTQSIFQKPEKLHLTLVVLTLVDEQEIALAKKILQNCYSEHISTLFDKKKKYLINIKGLEIMNDDSSEVNILYAKVQMQSREDTEKLQQMADKIAECFYRSGLAKRQYDRVKLHVTLMNTAFRDVEEGRVKFDASDILTRYRDFDFGKAELKNLQLSIRFTSGENKFYDSALTINL